MLLKLAEALYLAQEYAAGNFLTLQQFINHDFLDKLTDRVHTIETDKMFIVKLALLCST